jgi:formyl-CoA transferase
MRETPGFDPLLQALSGAMHQQGGGATDRSDGSGEPVFYTVALNDVMTPLLATFGVCAALYHRERSGEGQRIRLALARSAMAIQAAEFTHVPGAPPFPSGGIDYPGPSAAERWYRCADGRELYVEATTEAQRAALEAVTAAPIEAGALAAAFASRPLSEWLAALEAARVPALPITPRGEILHSEAVRANALAVTQQHAEYGETTNVGVLVHASRTPGRVERLAPSLSEHAAEVLTELGYTPEEQRALAEAGAVLLEAAAPSTAGGTF